MSETPQTLRIVYPHGSTWTFRAADTYCPRCGHRGMWLEGDDFYVGATGYCLACEHMHRCADDFDPFGDFERFVARQITHQSLPQEEEH